MAFTEFCCKTGGSNLNAGTRTGNSTEPNTTADFTYVSFTWVQATRVFTRLDAGDFTVDGITAGDFGSVYPDAATVSPFVARIITVTATTLEFSSTALMGTAPVDGVANTSVKIGGAWLGPNGASGFPFNVVAGTLTNATGDATRVNFKNSANFAITGAMTHTIAGPCTFEGYTTSYGDGGKAIIDGTIVGASYVLLTISGAQSMGRNLIFQNNGTTGSAAGVLLITAASISLFGCVVNNVRGIGIQSGGPPVIECEAYLCNTSNTANLAGFVWTDRGATFSRCIAHNNAGSNTSGFFSTGVGGGTLIHCISDTNGKSGLEITGTAIMVSVIGCDFYANVGNGILLGAAAGAATAYIENCNLVANGIYGINTGTSGNRFGHILNCGFGAGTQANTSGTTNALGAIVVIGSVTYPNDVTPWVDPADGDFRIQLLEAKETGRGVFTQTQSGYGDPNATLAYNDIGAAHHKADFPDPSEVESGVDFDDGDQTGTLVSSGGGSGTDDWIIGGPNG